MLVLVLVLLVLVEEDEVECECSCNTTGPSRRYWPAWPGPASRRRPGSPPSPSRPPSSTPTHQRPPRPPILLLPLILPLNLVSIHPCHVHLRITAIPIPPPPPRLRPRPRPSLPRHLHLPGRPSMWPQYPSPLLSLQLTSCYFIVFAFLLSLLLYKWLVSYVSTMYFIIQPLPTLSLQRMLITICLASLIVQFHLHAFWLFPQCGRS